MNFVFMTQHFTKDLEKHIVFYIDQNFTEGTEELTVVRTKKSPSESWISDGLHTRPLVHRDGTFFLDKT